MLNLYRDDLKGNKTQLELAVGSSYRGFKLPTVKNKSKCVKEIQEKSILVRVSARFEFSGVNCTLTALHSSFTYWEELTFKIAFELS